MGRGRMTDENDRSRRATLCNGLLKKAYELCAAVLSKVVITVVFSSRGRLQQCASNNRFSRPKNLASWLVMSVVVVLVMVETAASSSTYWAFHCAAGNFTAGSPYSNSLEAVAAILLMRVGSSPLLFASESAGGEVYALAQCLRLSSRLGCKRCVVAALRDAQKLCQSREGAIVFRDKCTVGYCNKKMVMFPDDPAIGISASRIDNTRVVIQSSEFKDAVERLQGAVVREAAVSPSSFATGQTEVKTVDLQVTIFAAAQCLPSMAGQDCDICLRKILYEMQPFTGPDLSPGRVASVWCSYRFAFYRFFNGNTTTLTLPAAEPPRAAEPPGEHTLQRKHQHDDNTTTWALVAVLVILSLLSVVGGLVYWWRNRKQQKKSSSNEVQCTETVVEVESQPSALDSFEEIVQMAKKKEIALFLDYDGTLAPIVRDPERAYMSNEMRGVLQNVANLYRTSIVSGRAIEKLFDFVRIKNISYAGSHGMDIKIATSTTEFASTSEIVEEDSYQPAKKYINMINEVHNDLVNATGEINGAKIENNKFCVSLHYRNVAKEDKPRVQRVIDKILEDRKDQVKLTRGKKVYEFRPPIDWDKGRAVLHVIKNLRLDDCFPIYIGDDLTDEDAFKVLREIKDGVGILVTETGRETNASYSLRDPAQVMGFLKLLVKLKQPTEK